MSWERDGTLVGSRHVIAVVGGEVDETSCTLGFYGPDLDPDEISTALNCLPTSAHRRGEVARSGRAWPEGAWLLRVEGRAPADPDALVHRLLDLVAAERAVWKTLVGTYRARLGFGIFMGAWNRGFELSTATLSRIAELQIPVGFDIYVDALAEWA